MLIAEDLLLLLLDDESGKDLASEGMSAALGGALLVELALDGAADVEPGKGLFRAARVYGDGSRPDDPMLAAAVEAVQEKPRSPQQLVERLGKHAKEALAERLVEQGILRRQDDRILGLFPRTRWPAADQAHEQQVRAELTRVLVEGQPADARTGALVALLSALDRAHRTVDHPGLSKGEVKKRAKQIAEGDWAAKAVKDSVDAARAAMIAATTVAVTAATTTTTS